MKIITYLTFFSGFSFLFFGITCFFAIQMKMEFERYGLAPYRRVVGGLQLIGGAGLLLGVFYSPILQAIAAGGLVILMVLGFLVRLKIKDTFIQSSPSIFYALLNSYIFYELFPF